MPNLSPASANLGLISRRGAAGMSLKELPLPLPVLAIDRPKPAAMDKADILGDREKTGAQSSSQQISHAENLIYFTREQLETILKAASIPGIRISIELPETSAAAATAPPAHHDPRGDRQDESRAHLSTTVSSSDFLSTPSSSGARSLVALQDYHSAGNGHEQVLPQNSNPSQTDGAPRRFERIPDQSGDAIVEDFLIGDFDYSISSMGLQSLHNPQFLPPVEQQMIPSMRTSDSLQISNSNDIGFMGSSALDDNFNDFLHDFDLDISNALGSDLHTFHLDVDQAMPSTLRYNNDPLPRTAFLVVELVDNPPLPENQGVGMGPTIPVSPSQSHEVNSTVVPSRPRGDNKTPRKTPRRQKRVEQSSENNENTIPCRPRRSRPLTEKERAETALVRKIAACLRCRLLKIKCISNPEDPLGECMQCGKIKMTISQLPCLRYKIIDTLMNRRGRPTTNRPDFNIRTYRWDDIKSCTVEDFQSSETRWIQVTQDYGPTMRLAAKRFSPIGGEPVSWKWRTGNGDLAEYLTPPFAIDNVEISLQEIQRSICNNLSTYVEGTLDESNSLISSTFAMVFNVLHDNPDNQLLLEVLHFWVACRMTEGRWRICGAETLGMSPQFDPASQFGGQIPLPPIMQQQVYRIVINQIILPLRKSILIKYQLLVAANEPSTWFSLFLATFVLTHNVERVIANNRDYATWWGYKEKFANFPLIEELLCGAKTLLAHFHYCCKGQMPFALDWDKEEAPIAELSVDQKRFMSQTQKHVKKNEARFQAFREKDRVGDNLCLVSQIFDPSWKPTKFLL